MEKSIETLRPTRKKHYKKRGDAGIAGSLYQIDVLTMVLLNGLAKVANWRLSTEDEDAAKFDDLIFEFLPSESAVLLQAKHKTKESTRVKYEDLMSVNSKNDFSLPKYFFSYQEILRRNKFKVERLVICTNLCLDENALIYLKQERLDANSILHFQKAENIFYSLKSCCLPLLKQNIQTYYNENVQNKNLLITDEAIENFLAHLQFFPNFLGDENLNNIIDETVSKVPLSVNMETKAIFKDIHEKMLDWFKEKTGRYLTEVEAKSFFCDIRSNKYCDEFKLYDISFGSNNLPLVFQNLDKKENKSKKGRKDRQKQIGTGLKNSKQITHIIPEKEYILNIVKIYQALPPEHKVKALFVNPDDTMDIQTQIIDGFKAPHYTMLVIVCDKTIEETATTEMCDNLKEILDNYEYKHVIVIAEEANLLARRIKNLKDGNHETVTGRILFSDLDKSTQEKLKGKKNINFQDLN